MRSILVFLLLITFCACQKEDNIDKEFYDITSCSDKNNADLIELNSGVLGKWYWYKHICLEIMQPDTTFNKGISIEFMDDSTYIFVDRNAVLKTGTWKIESGLNTIEITTIPALGELQGRLLLCNDRMVLNNIGRDICANFYLR